MSEEYLGGIAGRDGISFAQFYDLMEVCGPGTAVLMEGETGIGKSTVAAHFARDIVNLPLCTIQVSESTDMTDVFGLPDIDGDHTIYKPPSWYKPGQKCVLFMDEVNRNKVVMKGLMRLATDGRIGDIQLPEGSYILAAINPEYGNMYQVVEMDPAHRARFQVALLKPTVDEWIRYAKEEGVPDVITRYVKSHPDDLDTYADTRNVEQAKGKYYHHVLPCRRQWSEFAKEMVRGENFRNTGKSRFDPMLYDDADNFLYAVAAGRLGVGVATKFVKYYYTLKGGQTEIRAEKLLFGTDKEWKSDGPIVKTLHKLGETDMNSLIVLGEELFELIKENEPDMWNAKHNGHSEKALAFAVNTYKFLKVVPPEVLSSLYYTCIQPASDYIDQMKEKAAKYGVVDDAPRWPRLLCRALPKLKTMLDEVILDNQGD